MDKDTNKTNEISLKTEIPNREGWVDAHSLYQKLGVKTYFSTWIKAHIRRFGFIQEADYQITRKPSDNIGGKGWKLTKYALSPDMAKKISMFEQSKKTLNVEKITTFNFDDRKIRVIKLDGKLWFLTKEVSCFLGLTKHCKSVYNLDNDDLATAFIPNERSTQGIQIISEFGLLYMIIRSEKPRAVEVSKWFINEVLPQIHEFYKTSPSMLEKFIKFIKSFGKQGEA